jgi:23S rRNA (uridine2552-2'-O)-methyltransferase
MSKAYNRKDQLYLKAKNEGFRSRAAFKLNEVQKRYKILHLGDLVLDIGCWPGGWLQVVSSIVGERGLVAGIDLVKTESFSCDNIFTYQGDLTNKENLTAFLESLSMYINNSPMLSKFHGRILLFNSIVSDASPKLTGIREVDEARCIQLVQNGLDLVRSNLAPNGNYLVKLFKNETSIRFVKECSQLFKTVKSVELDSSRNSSKEFYMVAKGFNRK